MSMKKVLSPVGSGVSISNAVVGVSAGTDTVGKGVSTKPFASNPVPSKKRAPGQSAHSNSHQAKGLRPGIGAAKGGNAGTAPGKRKKSTGVLYLKSQSSERLSGTHSSKKALVRGKQSASQTILPNADP